VGQRIAASGTAKGACTYRNAHVVGGRPPIDQGFDERRNDWERELGQSDVKVRNHLVSVRPDNPDLTQRNHNPVGKGTVFKLLSGDGSQNASLQAAAIQGDGLDQILPLAVGVSQYLDNCGVVPFRKGRDNQQVVVIRLTLVPLEEGNRTIILAPDSCEHGLGKLG
jgi:hypothetical protein